MNVLFLSVEQIEEHKANSFVMTVRIEVDHPGTFECIDIPNPNELNEITNRVVFIHK